MSLAKTTAAAKEQSALLSKAVARAAERLGLQRNRLARVLGVSGPTVSRLYSGAYELDPSRKEWELALLFVRAYRALDSIVGGDQAARAWLQWPNQALLGRPAELIERKQGNLSGTLKTMSHYGLVELKPAGHHCLRPVAKAIEFKIVA